MRKYHIDDILMRHAELSNISVHDDCDSFGHGVSGRHHFLLRPFARAKPSKITSFVHRRAQRPLYQSFGQMRLVSKLTVNLTS